MSDTSNLLITGVPAIGKTTLIKRIANRIQTQFSGNINIFGFYTEEVRLGNQRIGFDVIDISDPSNRKVLSRLDNSGEKAPKVGKYSVDVNSFESIALPIIKRTIDFVKQTNVRSILIIDEIGKMEMFSDMFRRAIKQLNDKKQFCRNSLCIVATIPIQRNIQLVEELRESSDYKQVTVERTNRDHLVDDIVHMLCENSIK